MKLEFEIESKAKLANINIKINRKSIALIVSKLFIAGVIKLLSLNLKNSKVYFLKAILIFKNCNGILKSRKNNLMSKSNYL